MKPQNKVIVILLIATALMCAGFWFYPWIGDDLGYRLPFRHYFVDGEPVTFSQIWEQILFRHFCDNSRWSNIAMNFLIFTPKWVQAALGAAAVFGTLWLPLKVVGMARSPMAACLWAAAFALLMPWTDQMYTFDVQLNYLWTGVLGMLWLWMFLERRGSTAGFAAVSLLLGVWQESVAFPVFAGLVVLMIFERKLLDRRNAAAAVCLLIGLAWLYLSPGGLKYRGAHFAYFSGRSAIIWAYLLPLVAYVICLAVRLIRHRGVGRLHVFLLVSATVSAVVSLYALYGPRVNWWATLASLLGLLDLLMESGVSRRALKVAAAAAAAFAAVHLAVVDFHSYREGNRYHEAIALYRANPDSTHFMPITMRENAPWITLQKPYFGFFAHEVHIKMLSDMYGSREHPILVVPEELRSYREELGRRIPGTAGLAEYEGFMVAPAAPAGPTLVSMLVSYSATAGGAAVPMYEVGFRDADGQPRAWVTFNTSTLRALWQPVPERIDTIQ